MESSGSGNGSTPPSVNTSPRPVASFEPTVTPPSARVDASSPSPCIKQESRDSGPLSDSAGVPNSSEPSSQSIGVATQQQETSEIGSIKPGQDAVMANSSTEERKNSTESLEQTPETQHRGEHTEDVMDDTHGDEAKRRKVPKTENLNKHHDFGNEPPFAFLATDLELEVRLAGKLQACELGMKAMLESKDIRLQDSTNVGENARGLEDIIIKIGSSKKKQRSEVLVGVCGGTGVGKTSLLNGCLGIDELLPSGQEEAATAVPCKVSYNYDDRPGYECRAEVHFQDREKVIQELRYFIRAFTLRLIAEKLGILSDIQECEAVISQGMEQFSPVWKFQEDELEERLMPPDDVEVDQLEESTAQLEREEEALMWLLQRNPLVDQMLSDGLKTMQASTPKPLAKEMKKYLDSREGDHGSPEGSLFAIWPLVEEVRVFVKSDLLRHGIHLVDLPGIGDSNQCRNSVAGRYMERLHLTIIVSTIIRGKDTKDFHDLLGAQQETAMRLDGTLDKDHFAMVFTKTDDIQPKTYQFHSQEDHEEYARLETEHRDQSKQASRFEKDCKSLQKATKKTRRKMNKKKASQESIKKCKEAIRHAAKLLISLTAKRGIAEVKAGFIRERQVHLAIIARNRYVKASVESKILQQQKAFCRRGDRRNDARSGRWCESAQPDQSPDQHMARIFMTSSRGFWSLQKTDGKSKALGGLPTERFTGIPELRQWIQTSALMHQEGQLDDILADQQVVLELLNTWWKSAARSSTAPEPRATVPQVEEALGRVHESQQQLIEVQINDICRLISGLDPLGPRERARAYFRRQVVDIVVNWVRKFPENPRDLTKMHHMTYSACLQRDGSYYSKTTGQKYDWIQKLAEPILESLVHGWQQALQDVLEKVKAHLGSKTMRDWGPYAAELLEKIGKLDPILRSELADLDCTLQPIAASLRTDMESIIRELQERVSRMHHDAVCPSLEDVFREILRQAVLIRGTKSFATRQEYLKARTEVISDSAFNQVWHTLSRTLNLYKKQAQVAMKGLTNKAGEEVKGALRLGLGKGQSDGSENTVSSIRHLVFRWKEDWTFPRAEQALLLTQKLSIPDELTVDDLGKDHPVVSSNGVNYYDKLKKPHHTSQSDEEEKTVDEVLQMLKSAS